MLRYKDLKRNDKQLAQVVYYLCFKAGRCLSVKEILSLFYLAERDHLRRCGRFIFNDKNKQYFVTSDNMPPVEENMLLFLNSIFENGGIE